MDNETKIQEFATALRWTRRQGGDPSYRDLHRRMGYSIASISRVLTGKAFPKWDFTERFLAACRVPKEQISGRWHTRWLEIAEMISPLGDFPYQDETGPEPAPPEQAGTECTECGALMINPLRHQAWHMSYVRRPATRRDGRQLTPAPPSTALHRLSS